MEPRKKPGFVVKESNFSARVKKRWRFPRGKHSPVRQYHKGRPAMPNPGYGSPKVIKGFQKGVKTVLVNNVNDLLSIKDETAILGSNVGKRKKLDLIKLAKEKGIAIFGDVEKFVAKITEELLARKKVREEKSTTKTKKQAEGKKKAEKKNTEEKVKEAEDNPEEKSKAQKEMVDKTITKRQ